MTTPESFRGEGAGATDRAEHTAVKGGLGAIHDTDAAADAHRGRIVVVGGAHGGQAAITGGEVQPGVGPSSP
jgi:hypothetical protein